MVIGTAAAMLLTSCDGINVAGIQGSGSPTPAAAAAVGPITGFGSVFVNGVEYITSNAQILIDQQPGTEAQLHAGQVVAIKGNVNADGVTGTATEVSFNGDAQGPVAQIDLTNNTFVVLGQTVRVTGSTLFDDAIQPWDLTGLQMDTLVEVSGFANAAGEIIASRVDLKSAGSNLQVKGVIAGLDMTAHKFRIDALTVDYGTSSATPTLANGSIVEVQGTTLISTGELVATKVEVLQGVATTVNERADIEGIITSFTSSADFTLQGQSVITDANTQFVLHGVSLGVNVEVDVRGTVNASGALVANKVEVRPESLGLVRGLVDSVTAASNTVTVMGVNITTSASTVLDDKSSQHVKLFRLTDLHAGDYVEIHGSEGQTGTLSASTLERDNAESRSYLQGTALNVAAPGLTVLGVTVTTNAQTHFEGPGGTAKGAATFFSQAANHVVKVRGSFSGGVLTADQARIEQ
ncbi:MAG: hypothetical protein JWO04_4390 [Gammaproteobacteria bacterium]|nr:hypothetical protein [Gammaproteobacteria bacterium]